MGRRVAPNISPVSILGPRAMAAAVFDAWPVVARATVRTLPLASVLALPGRGSPVEMNIAAGVPSSPAPLRTRCSASLALLNNAGAPLYEVRPWAEAFSLLKIRGDLLVGESEGKRCADHQLWEEISAQEGG